jgi:hypothetical protein
MGSHRPDVKVRVLSYPVVAHARLLLGTFRRCVPLRLPPASRLCPLTL